MPGWDVAAMGEGKTNLLKLVDAAGDPTGITGLVYAMAPVRSSELVGRNGDRSPISVVSH